MGKKKPYAILIMDGYAMAPASEGNAITLSGSRNVNALMDRYPHSTLTACGMAVGLPEGQMGNSEVCHLNIGAGRIVYQDLTKISKAITDGDFFTNPVLTDAFKKAKRDNRNVHLYGLVSHGGVHSHINHLYALLKMAKQQGIENLYIHCFTDGRDVSPHAAENDIKELQDEIAKIGCGKIASVCGRYYAMDRDNNWERTEKAYDMLTLGTGTSCTDPVEAIKESYANGVTDEFLLPIKVCENGKPIGIIEKGDTVICFNFRPDRARQITRAVSQREFTVPKGTAFERKTGFLEPTYVCFTVYDATFTDVSVAFPKDTFKNTLGEYISSLGLTQLRIAETEKYAHVTFFFNGGVEKPNKNEDRDLIPSPKVATYDLQPEMSAYLITDKVLEELDTGKYDVVILNFANCDMVGHTAVIPSCVKAVDTVDECVKKVCDKILEMGGSAIVTADHGNADKLLNEDGTPFTAHTLNPVPVIIVSEEHKGDRLRDGGILADLAPTLLDIMGLDKPEEMTGTSLLVK